MLTHNPPVTPPHSHLLINTVKNVISQPQRGTPGRTRPN